MLGRGLVDAPALIDRILGEGKAVDKARLRAVHDRVYSENEVLISGED